MQGDKWPRLKGKLEDIEMFLYEGWEERPQKLLKFHRQPVDKQYYMNMHENWFDLGIATFRIPFITEETATGGWIADHQVVTQKLIRTNRPHVLKWFMKARGHDKKALLVCNFYVTNYATLNARRKKALRDGAS